MERFDALLEELQISPEWGSPREQLRAGRMLGRMLNLVCEENWRRLAVVARRFSRSMDVLGDRRMVSLLESPTPKQKKLARMVVRLHDMVEDQDWRRLAVLARQFHRATALAKGRPKRSCLFGSGEKQLSLWHGIEEGKSIKDLAAQFETSRPAIYRALRDIERNFPFITKEIRKRYSRAQIYSALRRTNTLCRTWGIDAWEGTFKKCLDEPDWVGDGEPEPEPEQAVKRQHKQRRKLVQRWRDEDGETD